ncbi:Uncharacterized protein Adt_11450 [Abeliophyllum distichum]|uniref:DUF4283 domain-containing protein n=1 Tax=Abeliophyllum distichum TaxID=126358 RepID=A0ABD1UMW9_9LAMI
MGIEAHLILAMNPIYGFIGDSIIPRETIVLITEMKKAPKTITTPMEYLVVKKSSSYHGVLGRWAHIDLETMTHTKFLCMKFSTDHGIATVRENQSEFMACKVNVIDVEMKDGPLDPKRMDDEPKEEDKQSMEQED